MAKKTAFTLLLIVLFGFFPAAVQAAGGEGIDSYTEFQLQISSLPEAKMRFIQGFVFPFLQGQGPLTRDNNIAAVLSADVTPISVFGAGEFVWTPAAFFLLSSGGKAGSGWDIPLGKGIGINAPEIGSASLPREAEMYGHVFDGLVWGVWGAGTLQFDLGAVVPGDWTHLLFQSRQEFRYLAYTGAEAGDSWILEDDDGENQNGWVYYANYTLGYRMPQSPILDTVALMAELEKRLYPSRGSRDWGRDLGEWIFSGLVNLTFTPQLSTTLALQLRTRRNYGTYNMYDITHYYQDLEIQNNGGKRHLIFYRAALVLSYKIK